MPLRASLDSRNAAGNLSPYMPYRNVSVFDNAHRQS
jgi:hypothetical protein